MEVILDSGYVKPFMAITVENKHELCDTLKKHFTLFKSKAVLDQLKSGLAELDVLEVITKYPDVLKPFSTRSSLTSGMTNTKSILLCLKNKTIVGDIKSILSAVYYSRVGSSERIKEEAILTCCS